MSTTKTYLHLAGVLFRDEANALEQRLLGGAEIGGKTFGTDSGTSSDVPTTSSEVSAEMGTTWYPSEPTSTDLTEPEASEQAGS